MTANVSVDHPLLTALDANDRDAVVASSVRRYARGATLFAHGDVQDGMHLLLSGHVAAAMTTVDGALVTFAISGPGDVVGELATLGGDPVRSATVTARDDVRTLLIPAARVAELRAASRAFDDALVGVLVERVRRLSDHLAESLHVPAEQRVVRRLIVLTRLYRGEDGGPTSVPVAQEEFASLSGTTRQTVNRTLRRLEDAGVVRLARAAVIVDDARRLAPFAR